MMEEKFTWDDVLAQVEMLKKCYNTFKLVLGMEDVWWDQEVNHVYAPAWDDIFKVIFIISIFS